jgi:2-dehydropantoate 2-reductase
MKVLVFGAGVVGSLFAAQLFRAGVPVTILARGKRYEDIARNGIVIDHYFQKTRTSDPVPVIEKIDAKESYDYVLVIMRKNQWREIVPQLAECACPNLIFLGNNGTGIESLIPIIAPERILLGFPGAGGKKLSREEGDEIVSIYKEKPAIFVGELDGSESSRLLRFKEDFQSVGFSVTISRHIDSWLKYHIAIIAPLVMGVYAAEGNMRKFAKDKKLMNTVIDAIGEGARALLALGYPLEPPQLGKLVKSPRWLIRFVYGRMIGSKKGELGIRDHALAARDEMLFIAQELFGLVAASGAVTPNLDDLKAFL